MNFIFQGFKTKIILKQLLPSPLCFSHFPYTRPCRPTHNCSSC